MIDLRVESSIVMYMLVSRIEVTSLGDTSVSRIGWARCCASLEMCQSRRRGRGGIEYTDIKDHAWQSITRLEPYHAGYEEIGMGHCAVCTPWIALFRMLAKRPLTTLIRQSSNARCRRRR